MRPENRLAQALVDKFGMTPPIDVAYICQQFARLSIEPNLPNGIDGLLIDRPGKRPEVVVDAAIHLNRRRFTVAHELGHLAIPWQSGWRLCDTHSASIGDAESEANRFAASLLLPTRWLQERLAEVDESLSAGDILEVARQAKVSPVTAMLQVSQYLEGDRAFAYVDGSGRVTYSCTTPDANCVVPRPGTVWSPHYSDSLVLTSADYGSNRLICYTFGLASPLEPSSACWREVQGLILDDWGLSGQDRTRMVQRINGIIGSANNRARERSHSALSDVLIVRLTRPDLAPFVNHSLFKEFVARRATSILGGR